jgi:hypothetical protein
VNAGALNDASGFQSGISAILRHGFKCPCGKLHGDELFQLANPDTLGLQVRFKGPRDLLGDVLADAALFLGETATVNLAALDGAGFGDAADFGHWKSIVLCQSVRIYRHSL